jgi:putative transposase
MVVSVPPKYSISSLMGYLKGKLALKLFQQYEALGKRYWGRHLWARGYCVSVECQNVVNGFPCHDVANTQLI